MKYTDEQIEALLTGIYDGTITDMDLPQDLYFAIADYLKKGLYKGFEGTIEDFTGKEFEVLSELRENIYMFSAAKCFHEVQAMSGALVDDDGYVRSRSEFKKAAADIYAQYNGGDFMQDEPKAGYIDAEYETAITQAQNCVLWGKIEKDKDILPYLRKSVVDDENTCEICGPLQGFTAPVNDPVWDQLAGELHFRCRCFEEQLDEDEGKAAYDPDEVKEKFETQTEKMDPMFRQNVYKTREVFNNQHPYFSLPKDYEDFAKGNFDLPIPDKD